MKAAASILPLLVGLLGLVSGTDIETKHFKTTDGTSYVYDFVPSQGANSTVLLLHGFPSTRRDWRYQVANLSAAGYGIIAPDLLGYGESDRPTELEAYKLKRMSDYLSEIVKHQGLQSVVAVGHDWGTMVLSRSLYWHRELYEKVAFLSTGYNAVGSFFDVDAVNIASLENFRYMQYGYWYFFNSYNAKDLIEERVRPP